MTRGYDEIAFTAAVSEVQERYGSRTFYDRRRSRTRSPEGPARTGEGDALSPDEREYLSERDSFYLATVSETGWPYVQFRGGPPGFLRVLDDHTIGWADFRGNLQYISTGNLAGNDRVALIVMDYPNRQRLKIYGHARVVTVEDEPELATRLAPPNYQAVVQRAVLVSVQAFDWNCQQHITPRYSPAELAPVLATMRQRISDLEQENERLAAAAHLAAAPDGRAQRDQRVGISGGTAAAREPLRPR
jgi:predicted pyridoxine 5'-phosphate oxidase superfamily flavin-nucleotide-binding protein